MNLRISRMTAIGAASVAAVLLLGGVALAAAPPAPHFNGFENVGDVNGPTDDTMDNVTRVTSGTNGILSADGAHHAIAGLADYPHAAYLFTRYGGYSSVFPDGGYTTSADIYLDMAESQIDEDSRFDWSSAINGTDGNHQRDFIFSVGTDGAGGFVMSASNNAPGWPANPGRDPLTITTTGWYTFQHVFYDDGGVLAVDMSVLDSDSLVLNTWTLSYWADTIDGLAGEVGGNRYGWLVTNDFDGLPIDNVFRSGVLPSPVIADDCKKHGWETVFRADETAFVNQGVCIQYVLTGK
ncbi:MAG: hypothetical protein HOH95_15115 [Dehalococcoidia bacterium]|jgi:hypothetical protein|nr:hypothetical protein [Dehalococcoidia bacterium]